MAILRLGYNNLLYLIIFAISSTGQMKLIEMIEIYPQLLIMFFDSFHYYSLYS